MIVNIWGNYRINGRWYPLPWGEIQVENVLVYGGIYNSKGGCWYFILPEYCYVGYGRYNPYVEFYFTGLIEITRRRRDDFSFGGRIGDSKWMYFRGKIVPTERYRIERLFFKYPLVKVGYWDSQGSLRVEIVDKRPLEEVKKKLLHRGESIPSRRKIFNHQFFGDCNILFNPLSRGSDELQWLVECDSEVEVVSPDHLNQPMVLKPGWYLATHPYPGRKGVD